MYVLFSSDHSIDDFQFATDLLQEYIENNFSEFNSLKENSKRSSAKNKSKWRNQQVKTNGESAKSSVLNGIQDPAADDEDFSDTTNGDDEDDILS